MDAVLIIMFILPSYSTFVSYIPYLFLHLIYFLNEESVMKQFPLCQRQTYFAFHNETQNYRYIHFSLNKNVKHYRFIRDIRSRNMHKLKCFDEIQSWKIKQSLSYWNIFLICIRKVDVIVLHTHGPSIPFKYPKLTKMRTIMYDRRNGWAYRTNKVSQSGD